MMMMMMMLYDGPSLCGFHVVIKRLNFPQNIHLMLNYSATSNNTNLYMVVDGWAVTFGTARRGLGGLWPRPIPSSLYQM